MNARLVVTIAGALAAAITVSACQKKAEEAPPQPAPEAAAPAPAPAAPEAAPATPSPSPTATAPGPEATTPPATEAPKGGETPPKK